MDESKAVGFTLILVAQMPNKPEHMIWGTNELEIFQALLEEAFGTFPPTMMEADCLELSNRLELKLPDIESIGRDSGIDDFLPAVEKLICFLRNCGGYEIAPAFYIAPPADSQTPSMN